jgi:hypothetical protein
VANCPHGFPEDQCLICQTLGTAPPQAGRGVKAQDRPGSTLLVEPAVQARLPARSQDTAPAAGRRGSGARVMAGLGVIVVAGLLVWAFAGLFVLAFHIFEYAALAVVAGWLGYKLGHFRGRRERRGT